MIRQGFVGCGRFSSPRICLAPWQGRQWQCLWYHVPESRNCHEGPHPLEFQLDNLVSSARSLVGVGGICGYCFLCFSWCYYALFLSCFFTILKKMNRGSPPFPLWHNGSTAFIPRKTEEKQKESMWNPSIGSTYNSKSLIQRSMLIEGVTDQHLTV
jgi:hypothetical protein